MMSMTRHADVLRESAQASAASSRDSSRPDSPFGQQGSLILRIKRKRGVDPVTALRIETLRSEGGGDDSGDVSQSETQLAGTSPEELSGGLAKRRLTERSIFRLAETVPLTSFKSEEKTKELEDRIARLKRPAAKKETLQKEQKESSASPELQTKPVESRPAASNLRFKVVSHAKSARRSLFDTLKANNNSSGSLRAAQRHARSISKSKRASNLFFRPRYIDAVVDAGSNSKGKARGDRVAEDEEMSALDRRFAGLLGDYLKDQDLVPPSDVMNSGVSTNGGSKSKRPSSSSSASSSDDEDDYVYDIYYREREPSTWGAQSTSSAADIGLRPSDIVGHDRDLSSSTQLAAQAGPISYPEAMATLVGLSEQDAKLFGDDEEIEKGSKLVSEEMLDSDDPYEEGEDEDSNDEGFYRNDYPEQEADDDDELFESSAWGWSGPRRRERGSDSDQDGDEEDGESNGSF